MGISRWATGRCDAASEHMGLVHEEIETMPPSCRMLLLASLAVGLVGCGGSDSTRETPISPNTETLRADAQTANGQASASSKADSVTPRDTSKPESAVAVFLDALRRGDDEQITRMYTVPARQQAAKHGRQYAPQASDTASFKVGRVDYYPEDRAGVECQWTDLDQHGQPHTLELVWILRREPEGWRVGGVVAEASPGEPPMMLDFEKLDEALRQVDEAQRQAADENLQAQQPGASADSLKR